MEIAVSLCVKTGKTEIESMSYGLYFWFRDISELLT